MTTNKNKAQQSAISVSAKHGEKMIEVKLRFWTGDISDTKGEVVQKHAWSSGVVRMERNDTHGIAPGSPRHFHSLLDIGAVIERVLIEHGITLHTSEKMQKYLLDKSN